VGNRLALKSDRKGLPRLGSVIKMLRTQLRAAYAPGDRLPSTEELHKSLGASVNTVHAALAVLASEGFVVPRHGRGVYVLPRAGETWVGILSELDILHPHVSGFSVRLPRAVRRCFHAHGIRTRLYVGDLEPGKDVSVPCREFVDDLKAGRLDGVVTTDTLPNLEWMAIAAELGVPVAGSRAYPCGVHMDVLEMVPEGVRRLYAQGCRRIAMLVWSGGPAVERFAAALESAGLPLRPRWIRQSLHPCLPGAGWEELREVWTAYPEKPDGLLFCDDQLFRDALPAILSLGKSVPGDLKIVSHRNRGSGLHAPFPVTWAEIDPDAYAEALVSQILRLIRTEPLPQDHIRVSCHWIEETGTALAKKWIRFRNRKNTRVTT